MSRSPATVTLSWSHFATMWGICALAGAAVGVSVFIVTQFRGTSWQEALALAPLVIFEGLVVAVPIALVASLIGAVPLLLMRRYRSQASLRTWVVAGGLAGVTICAFPFLLLLGLLVYRGEPHSFSDVLSVVAILGAPGGFAGLLVGWWYRSKAIGPQREQDAGASTLESRAV